MSAQQDANMTAASNWNITTMVPTATSKLHIFDLPVESKLQILSNLSAKEIQRARQISKHVRDLIDHPRNRSMLVAPVESRALRAIRATYDQFTSFDPQKVDLLELTIRVSDHRATMEELLDTDGGPEVVSRLWCHANAISNMQRQHDVVVLADLLLVLNFYCRAKCSNDRSVRWTEEGIEYCSRYRDHYAAIGVAKSAFETWIQDIKTTEKFTLPGRNQLETLYLVERTEHSRLKDILDIPYIPDALASVLHYCVQSEWAHEKLKKVLSIDAKADLTALEKAAILEEICLFTGDVDVALL